MRMGRWPIVRIAVLPVPMPRCTRPGASRLSVAIAWATMTPGARPRVVRDLHDWLRHILPDGHPLGGHSQRPCGDRRADAPAWPAGLPGRALRPLPPRELSGCILAWTLTRKTLAA